VFKLGARFFLHFSSQTLLNKDRQCCKSWRNAELGVRADYAVGDTTDEDRWVDLLCCSPHCGTAEMPRAVWRTIRSPHSVWVLIATTTDDWRRPSSAVRRPSYDVPSMSSTTQCSNSSAIAINAVIYNLSYVTAVSQLVLILAFSVFVLYISTNCDTAVT